jgi:hypothetical protein
MKMPTTQEGRRICPRHQVVIVQPSEVELDLDLVPLDQSHRGFDARIAPVTKEERDSIALTAAGSQRFGTPEKLAEQEAEHRLRVVLVELQNVNRAAETAGYGDQFMGSVDEAIKQVRYTLGMLA